MQMDATLFLFSVGKQSYTVKLVTAMFVVQLFLKQQKFSEVGEDSEEGCAYPTNKKTTLKNSKLSSRFFL